MMSNIVTILLLMGIAYAIHDLLLGPCAIWRPRKDVIRYMREQNERRGITMRPGWRYLFPDGSSHCSKTGRATDCNCGGKHSSHQDPNQPSRKGYPCHKIT